jgi:hypothetical protein
MNGSVMFVLLGFFQYKLEACLTLHMCFKSFISNTSDIFLHNFSAKTQIRKLPIAFYQTMPASLWLVQYPWLKKTKHKHKYIYINTFLFWLHNDLGLTWLSSVRSTVQHPMTKILWNTGAWFGKLIFPLPWFKNCNTEVRWFHLSRFQWDVMFVFKP